MNKGIPYLLAALVALSLTADWAAPVLALFDRVAACLDSGGHLDLLEMRCVSRADGFEGLPTGWAAWTLLGIVVAGLAFMMARWHERR